MSGDRPLDLVYLAGCLVIVGSALAARRLPMRQAAKMALAWIAIFAAGFLIFAFKDEIAAKISPESGTVAGGALRIPVAEDGHYWVRGRVNDRDVRFLIDSGASQTALSLASTKAAGIETDDGAFGVAISTANGTVVARRVTIGALRIGPILRRDWPAIAAREFGETNVLGMDFLSSLHGWGVEGRTLVLRP